MSQEFSIALDAMGGDHGPSVVVPAALQVLKESSQLRIILVGDEAVLAAEIAFISNILRLPLPPDCLFTMPRNRWRWMKSPPSRYAPKKIPQCV